VEEALDRGPHGLDMVRGLVLGSACAFHSLIDDTVSVVVLETVVATPEVSVNLCAYLYIF